MALRAAARSCGPVSCCRTLKKGFVYPVLWLARTLPLRHPKLKNQKHPSTSKKQHRADVVVGAAHCFNGFEPDLSGMDFTVGAHGAFYYDDFGGGVPIKPAKVVVHPDYTGCEFRVLIVFKQRGEGGEAQNLVLIRG
jgi:hypothetical protein